MVRSSNGREAILVGCDQNPEIVRHAKENIEAHQRYKMKLEKELALEGKI